MEIEQTPSVGEYFEMGLKAQEKTKNANMYICIDKMSS